MPRRPTRDWDEDDWDEDEWDEDAPEEHEEMVACPYCMEMISEHAERCPHCENWISEEDEEAMPEGKPAWVVMTAVICLVLILFFWVFKNF
jgi:hypothetical protein